MPHKSSSWHIFFWAMLHSPEFRQCRVYLPFFIKLNSGYRCDSRFYSVEFYFRRLSVYVPYQVRNQYEVSVLGFEEYDDIPF